MNELVIRPANPSDAPKIIAGINEICAERKYLITARFESDADWDASLYRPDQVPNHLLLVAEVEGLYAGWVRVFPEPLAGDVGQLGIGVLSPFRGHGVGYTLIREALARAKGLCYNKIVLSVRAADARAIHLYRKFGFVSCSKRYRQYAFMGTQEELIMVCSLATGIAQEPGMSTDYTCQTPSSEPLSFTELPLFESESTPVPRITVFLDPLAPRFGPICVTPAETYDQDCACE